MSDPVSVPGSHLDQDRLLDLLHGLLEPAERATALAHLRSCDVCGSEFRDMATSSARARVRFRGMAKPPVARLPGVWSRSIRVRWLATAAGVVFVVGVLLTFERGSRPTRLPNDPGVLPAARLAGVTRSVGVASDSLVRAGLALYETGDMRGAVARFSAARATGPMERVRLLYLGSALARLGRDADAVAVLGGIDAWQVPQPWRDDGHWALAVVLSRSGSTHAADSVLRLIATGHGPLSERARAVLSDSPSSR